MAKDLIVELGTEELPDRYLWLALSSLPDAVGALLDGENLAHGAVRAMGTPRRIAVIVEDLASMQPDEVREVKGPPEKVAVDPQTGAFTKAALRFAEKHGAGPDDLGLVDTPRGRVCGLEVTMVGRPAGDVVASRLAEVFSDRSLPYPQAMFWESHTGPFIRPVHWLVLLHGSDVVEADLHGVRSGRRTRGHRFHSPGWVEIEDASSYERTLESHGVVVDQTRRREILESGLASCAAEAGATIVHDDDLLEEVVALTELPVPILGTFDERFLALPDQVVITAMAVHQRYFALRDPSTGALRPSFIAVSNTEPRSKPVVRRGFERVLTARLDDARFCYEEDLKRGLSELGEKLDGVVFQGGLGTYLDKTRRLAELAPALARLVAPGSASEDAVRRAALVCKADLITKVVYEFPELQGIMGGEYARREGLPEPIPEAIRDHYRPEGPSDELPGTTEGQVLALADKVDTLTGFFGMGRRPRGGSDPFGLRRACLGVIRILLALETDVALSRLVDMSYPLFKGQNLEVSNENISDNLLDFMEGRLRVLWGGGEVRTDLVNASLACGVDSVLQARRRLDALVEFKKSEEFEDLAVAFKRAYRIVRDESDLPRDPDPALFAQSEESALLEAVSSVEGRVASFLGDGDFSNVFNEFRLLRAPVDAFFDKVFVNVDDPDVRRNRLALLSRIVRMIEPAARLDLVQFEKTKLH